MNRRDAKRTAAAHPTSSSSDSPPVKLVGKELTFTLVAIALAIASVVAFAPGSYFRWFLPKELVLVLAVVVAALAPASGRIGRIFWAICIGGVVWLLISAVSAGAMPLSQVLGRWPRYEGLVAIPVYIAAAWLAARLLGGRANPRAIDFWHRCVAIASLALTAVTLLETSGLKVIESNLSRPGALLGNASDQGLVAVVFALLLAVPAFRASTQAGGSLRPVLLYGGGLLGAVVTVVLSGSRGALVALAVGALLGFVVVAARVSRQRGRRGTRNTVWAAGAALILTLGVVAITPGMRDRLFGLSPLSGRTIQDRFAMWEQAFDIVVRSPLFGVGPSGYADAVARTLDRRWYSAVEPGTILDSPHSILFQSLVSGGWVLVVIAFVGTCYIAIRWGRVVPRAMTLDAPDPRADLVLSAGIALVGLVVGLLTHFSAAATGILGGLLVGIIVAEPLLTRPPRWRKYVPVALLSVWLLAFVAATAADYRIAAAITAPTATEADREFAAAQSLRPWDSDISSIAAQSLTQRADAGDPAAPPLAIIWSERAMELLPESLAPRIAHAVATRLDGRPDDAVELLRQAHTDYPNNPDVAVQLAIAHLELGQIVEAQALLVAVQQVWPDDEFVSMLLDRLP